MIYRTAVLSACRRYRYALTRYGESLTDDALFVMLNPSTADEHRDDATIRKLIGFTQRWGLDGFRVANLFAYRATEPRDLVTAQRQGIDIVGPRNLEEILAMANGAKYVVVAWGAHGELFRDQAKVVLDALRARCGHRLWCFGKTKGGHPLHPLMLSYETKLVRFGGDL